MSTHALCIALRPIIHLYTYLFQTVIASVHNLPAILILETSPYDRRLAARAFRLDVGSVWARSEAPPFLFLCRQYFRFRLRRSQAKTDNNIKKIVYMYNIIPNAVFI